MPHTNYKCSWKYTVDGFCHVCACSFDGSLQSIWSLCGNSASRFQVEIRHLNYRQSLNQHFEHWSLIIDFLVDAYNVLYYVSKYKVKHYLWSDALLKNPIWSMLNRFIWIRNCHFNIYKYLSKGNLNIYYEWFSLNNCAIALYINIFDENESEKKNGVWFSM